MTEPADTPGIDRAAFMARVRGALRRDAAAAIDEPPPVDETIVRLAEGGADLTERFMASARGAGVTVHEAPAAALAAKLHDIFVARECRRIAVSIDDEEDADTARSAVASSGAAVLDWRKAPGLDVHYDADAGVTDVDAAIAETGSLVVSSGATRSRGTFLVPAIHVAVLPASAIVPDLIDFWVAWKTRYADAPPAATVIITGPSKTADIEGILITGVHGPKVVEVVVVTDR